jgi:hypothetical protein
MATPQELVMQARRAGGPSYSAEAKAFRRQRRDTAAAGPPTPGAPLTTTTMNKPAVRPVVQPQTNGMPVMRPIIPQMPPGGGGPSGMPVMRFPPAGGDMARLNGPPADGIQGGAAAGSPPPPGLGQQIPGAPSGGMQARPMPGVMPAGGPLTPPPPGGPMGGAVIGPGGPVAPAEGGGGGPSAMFDSIGAAGASMLRPRPAMVPRPAIDVYPGPMGG